MSPLCSQILHGPLWHTRAAREPYSHVVAAQVLLGYVGTAFNVAFTLYQRDVWHAPLRSVSFVMTAGFVVSGAQ